MSFTRNRLTERNERTSLSGINSFPNFFIRLLSYDTVLRDVVNFYTNTCLNLLYLNTECHNNPFLYQRFKYRTRVTTFLLQF